MLQHLAEARCSLSHQAEPKRSVSHQAEACDRTLRRAAAETYSARSHSLTCLSNTSPELK